jgi:hypothetical protein
VPLGPVIGEDYREAFSGDGSYLDEREVDMRGAVLSQNLSTKASCVDVSPLSLTRRVAEAMLCHLTRESTMRPLPRWRYASGLFAMDGRESTSAAWSGYGRHVFSNRFRVPVVGGVPVYFPVSGAGGSRVVEQGVDIRSASAFVASTFSDLDIIFSLLVFTSAEARL